MRTNTKAIPVLSVVAMALPGCQLEQENPPDYPLVRAIPAIVEAVLAEQQRQLPNTDWFGAPIYFDHDSFRRAMNTAGLPELPSRAGIASHLPNGVIAIPTDSVVIRTEKPDHATFEIKDDGLLIRTQTIEATPSGYQVSVEGLTTERRGGEHSTVGGRLLQLSIQRNGGAWKVVNSEVFIRLP